MVKSNGMRKVTPARQMVPNAPKFTAVPETKSWLPLPVSVVSSVDALKFARISSASSVGDDSRGQAATSLVEHFEEEGVVVGVTCGC